MALRSLGPAPRKRPTRDGLKVARERKPSLDRGDPPRPAKQPNPYEDIALQLSNTINRCDE